MYENVILCGSIQKGKTDDEILKEREKAIASAKRNFAENEEVEVIDSFF